MIWYLIFLKGRLKASINRKLLVFGQITLWELCLCLVTDYVSLVELRKYNTSCTETNLACCKKEAAMRRMVAFAITGCDNKKQEIRIKINMKVNLLLNFFFFALTKRLFNLNSCKFALNVWAGNIKIAQKQCNLNSIN